MTSLAKQLQRLALPHTQAVLGDDKQRASLLFDPREASNFDRETFHALGLNGIEELSNIDANFEEFESILFGDATLTFERSIQTKEVNDKLDENIGRFLIHLSPYCLLKPAHKALEWLIHRFSIHLYNSDALLLCFLPYHESKVFARALQVIRFDSRIASKWDFLHPLQKAGVSLTRTTLVNHCKTDLGFLSFVCDMIPKAVKVLTETNANPKCRVLFSFYATTVIGVLDGADGGPREELLGLLLPHLSRGLNSRVHEYKAATYMVLAQLLHKASLKQSLLKTLMQVLVKGMVSELLEEGVACLLLLFQTQNMDGLKLGMKTFRHLCQHHGLVSVVANLSAQFQADLFLSVFLARLIPAAFKRAVGIATSGETSESDSSTVARPIEYVALLHRLLSNITLSDEIAENAAFLFLEKYVHHGNKYLDEDVDDRIKDILQGIVRQLEGKHSDAVDRAVTRMQASCHTEHERELVHEFLNLYVLSVPHHLVTDAETSLALSLNHRLPSVRQKAVAMLVQNRNSVDDDDFLKDSLTLRLKDEDSTVVLAALNIGKDIWSVMRDELMVIGLLKKIVLKGLADKDWLEAATAATKISGTYKGEHQLEVINSYLPCFYLLQTSELAVSEKLVGVLLKSKLATQNTLLQAVAREMKKEKASLFTSARLAAVNHRLARFIALGLSESLADGNTMEIVTSWMSQAVGHQDIRVASLVLVVLDEVVAMTTNTKVKLMICQKLLQLIASAEQTKGLQNDSCSLADLDKEWSQFITLSTVAAYSNKLSTAMCLKALHSVVNIMQVPGSLAKESTFWHLRGDGGEADLFLQVSVRLYDMFLNKVMSNSGDIKSVATFRALFKKMEKQCFSESSTYLKFLGLLWTQHANDLAAHLGLTLTLQARSLHLGLAYIKTLDGGALGELLKTASFFSHLLMVLTSEHSEVRSPAVQIAAYLLAREEEHGSVFKPLLTKLVRCEGEIAADGSYIYQAMVSIFKSTSLDEASGAATPRKTRTSRKSVGTSPGKGDKPRCLAELLDLVVDEATPDFVQHKLLEVFILLDSKDVLTRLLPLMSRLLDQSGTALPRLATQSLNLVLRRFTLATTPCLGQDSPGLAMFVRALGRHGQLTTEELKSCQMVALEQLTKEMYAEVEARSQQKLLSTLFDVAVETKDLKVSNQVLRVLKHISVDGKHIQEELKRCLKQSTAKTVREAKKQKRVTAGGDADEVTEFDTRDWQRSTVVLEALQNKKKIHNYTLLLPVSFQLLASILDSDSHTSAEYIKQLVLSLLYNICSRLEKKLEDPETSDEDMVLEEQFNMELIVNCIRSSDNPQTHHQALLLLTSAVKIFPEHLVHKMMTIFTFMGQSILRQDDAYSFHIISKILETVIPALITANKPSKKTPKKGAHSPKKGTKSAPASATGDQGDHVTMVIQVFVDSYPHMPAHRRQLLFHKLLTVVGPERYLGTTLMLMMDQLVAKGTLKAELASEEAESSLYTSDVEFCLNLCSEFPTTVQFDAATEIMKFLIKLPDEKDEDVYRKPGKSPSKTASGDACIYDIALHTDKQLRHFKYANIHLLVSLFSSTSLLAQLSHDVTDAGYTDLSESFQQVLETLLQLVTHMTKVANRSGDKPTAKFWRALQHKTHDLLDKFVSLLPDALFIEVIGGLLGSHDLPTIQRKALDLLNTKLQQQRDFTQAETDALLPMVKQLVSLSRRLLLGNEITDDASVNGQAAFISLKLLCRSLGYNNPDVFVKVLKTAVEVYNTTRDNNLQVCSCALLCVAEVCSCLKVHVIPQLPTFMPALIAAMKHMDSLVKNELYLLSVVTTINKVVENLSKFLSPYLLDITVSVCVMCTRSSDIDALQKTPVQLRLKAIRSTLSGTVDTRVLVPVVEKAYEKLIKKKDIKSISSLMSLFGDHVGHIAREDLTSQLTKLQALFLRCLDLRIDHPEIDPSTLSEVEGVTIETIIDMVMKLSESTFKPFLFKLFDWATSSDDVRDRVLVFYRLADRLAERLRSLFTLFAGHIISHIAKMLETNNHIKNGDKFFPDDKNLRKKSCQLLIYVLDCVYRCCLYDTEGFITRDRFETLMQPLVDQIENTQGGEARYTDRVQAHLVPCIVQLAVAAQDDSLWRTLNYQVCLTTRAQEPEVKLSALHVLDDLHRKLGEDYMPLLPDAVPFLSELMEDDSEEVEKKCHEVIREMEKTLGEPLQKYF